MHITIAIVGHMAADREATKQGRLGCNMGHGTNVLSHHCDCTDAAESIAGSEEVAFAGRLCTTTNLQAGTQ
jgi:hypothetical protein